MNKEQYKTYLRQRLYEGIGDIINAITNDTSSFRYGLRNIPGVAAVEKKVAEAGYFPTGGFYDRNSDGKEDDVESSKRASQAAAAKSYKTPKQKEDDSRPYKDDSQTPRKTITGHPGEIPNSDPLPSDTQRA